MGCLSAALSDVFLMIRQGLWPYQRSKLPFFVTSFQEYILSTQLITTDVDLDHLAEVVFARLLRCKIPLPLLPFPCFSIWKEVTVCSSHVRSGKLCSTFWRAEYLHKLFGIFLPRRCLISLTYLFFQSLILYHPVTFAHMYL